MSICRNDFCADLGYEKTMEGEAKYSQKNTLIGPNLRKTCEVKLRSQKQAFSKKSFDVSLITVPRISKKRHGNTSNIAGK
jgi:hypothetical protein